MNGGTGSVVINFARRRDRLSVALARRAASRGRDAPAGPFAAQERTRVARTAWPPAPRRSQAGRGAARSTLALPEAHRRRPRHGTPQVRRRGARWSRIRRPSWAGDAAGAAALSV